MVNVQKLAQLINSVQKLTDYKDDLRDDVIDYALLGIWGNARKVWIVTQTNIGTCEQLCDCAFNAILNCDTLLLCYFFVRSVHHLSVGVMAVIINNSGNCRQKATDSWTPCAAETDWDCGFSQLQLSASQLHSESCTFAPQTGSRSQLQLTQHFTNWRASQ